MPRARGVLQPRRLKFEDCDSLGNPYARDSQRARDYDRNAEFLNCGRLVVLYFVLCYVIVLCIASYLLIVN